MITHKKGNLLKDDADVICNAVNCVGVMGSGIAADFKNAYPEMFKAYVQACDAGQIAVGKNYYWPIPNSERSIANVVTKIDWRDPSELEWVEKSIMDLAMFMTQAKLVSVAVCPFGCGLGGLKQAHVLPLIEVYLKGFDVRAYNFEVG